MSKQLEAQIQAIVGGDAQADPSIVKPKSREQVEYEEHEVSRARKQIQDAGKAPLRDRQKARANFLEVMQKNPEIIAERIDWILEGNYGFGAMVLAKRVIGASGRTNKQAQLVHMVAALDYQCPNDFAVDAWNRLTKAQKAALDEAVGHVIDEADATY